MAKVTQITSRRNPLLARLRKLADDGASYRRLGVVLLEGEHLCAAWLARPQRAGAARDRQRRGVGRAAPAPAGPGGGRGRGRRCRDARPSSARSSRRRRSPFSCRRRRAATVGASEPTLVLDRLQDPGNVGSVLRSAAAFGFTQAIALVGTAALWSPKVVRAGMGAHFGLRLVEGADDATLGELAVPLFGTSSHAGERARRVRAALALRLGVRPRRAGRRRRRGGAVPGHARHPAAGRRRIAQRRRRRRDLPVRDGTPARSLSGAAIRYNSDRASCRSGPARVRQEGSSRGHASARPLQRFRRLPCDS